MTEQDALLVLNAVPDLGARRIRKLMDCFGSAAEALKADQQALMGQARLLAPMAENIIKFSKDKFLQDEYNLRHTKGIAVITAVDEGYPCSLKTIEDAPVVLYVKGDSSCLQHTCIGMVGSRAATYYGCRTAKEFAKVFAQAGLVVVSGLARGIDTAAHQGCLEAKGKTVAVIGCGFNYMYPKENVSLLEAISRNGAVVSEFAMLMPPLKHNFPWRNRIISGLSCATVVIEARERSGALITADYAMAQNREVFVVPGNIDHPAAKGSNRLIQDGATVALGPEDVVPEINQVLQAESSSVKLCLTGLTDEEQQGLQCITSEPVHLDDLVERAGINISRMMAVTLSLELKGAIRQLPGQYYVRNDHA